MLLPLEHRAPLKLFVSLQFLNLIDSRQDILGRGISPPPGDYIQRATQTQNKHRQTSVPRVGFEDTTPVFERALHLAAIVIGCNTPAANDISSNHGIP
jgi:hypothetical protein